MKSKLQVRAKIALLAVLLTGILQAGAQDNREPDCAKGYKADGTLDPQACNGISVGAPKVFDNRTLTLMLESLSQTLKAQQQNYIDQKSVAAALANIQGFSQTETSTNLSLTTTPTPATDVKTTLNTGNVDANGNPLPNTFQRQTDVNRASVTPQVPALDTLPAFQGFTPTYGNSAADLLSDQVNLTYQIFNLRMILERALSDRLNPDANGDNKTRLQAVLGLNVTLDPPRTANDAVAVVEITLTSNDKDKKDLSLVALMPQEKTYNAAALSSKSNAFAGSAVVSSFQVGFSARKRGQVFYLYRDNDTISYERMTGDPKKIVFGWMFRPVLGRRSVSPGLRQLFAIMALPGIDCTDVDPNCKTSLTSTVRTYWKKYDRGTLTSFEHRDANRASLFWYGLSLGLTKPQIFGDHKYENKATYPDLTVQSSANYQDALKPTVKQVTWRPTGAKNIVISARGNNFFSQTKVALGDSTYGDGSGLILKSNQAFDLITTLDALVNGPGTILGRYDIGVPLTNQSLPNGLPPDGVEVRGAFLTPALAGIRKVEIHLQGKPSSAVVIKAQEATSTLREASGLQQTLKKQLDESPLSVPAPDKHARKVLVTQQTLGLLAFDLKEMLPPESPAAGAEAAHEFLMRTRESILQATQELETAASAHDIAPRDVRETLADARTKLNQALSFATNAHTAAQKLLDDAAASIKQANLLAIDHLPQAPETPIVSVNGTPLDLPYEISNTTEGGLQHVVIQANVKDSLVSETGGGVVKISWPFYPQDKWTTAYRFYNPDLAFEVTHVSSKSIVIHRNDGPSFLNGPETTPGTPACWKLIAGDTEVSLTAACPAKPAPKDCEKKAKPDACAPPPLGVISDYTVTATVADLPDKVVLVAPSGSIYNLTVPPVKAKDDKVGPIELKQYDSQWIEIKASELTTGAAPAASSATGAAKGAKDFTGLTAVEANNGPVNYVLPEADPKAVDEKTKKPKPPASIKVEITRALTSKPGTVDIAFRAGKRLLGTRQIHITQTEWGNKGDK